MALVDCVVTMQDATNLHGNYFDGVEGVESVGLWMSSVGRLIRWLRANSSHEHADHLELIVVGLRRVVAASLPESYRQLEVKALKRIARRLQLIAKTPPSVLSPGQRDQLHELLDAARISVNNSQHFHIVEWSEKGLAVSMDSDINSRVASRPMAVNREKYRQLLNAARPVVNVLGPELRNRLDMRIRSAAVHARFRSNVLPNDQVATARPEDRNVELPVIFYHGGRSYSLDGKRSVGVSIGAHHILQSFLKEKRAMRDPELAEKVTNPSQVIIRLKKKHNEMFRYAIRRPQTRGEGYLAYVQHAPSLDQR